MSKLLRETAFEFAVKEVNKGVREVGGNNHGPDVKKYLAEVGLPEGYAWCTAFISWCFRQAAGKKLAWESAGVWNIWNYAKEHGWIVDRPRRFDLVAFDFNGDGVYNEHMGWVAWVKKFGPVSIVHTIEANTSSGVAGSQTDGGGVYRRTRLIRSGTAAYIRVPGRAPLSAVLDGGGRNTAA